MRRQAVVAARALASCGDSATSRSPSGSNASADGGAGATPSNGVWTFATIKEQTMTLGDKSFRVEFIRAERPDGKRSFMIYRHSASPKAALVISDEPYSGIDWSGDDVDTRWVARGSGPAVDDDAPNYNNKDKIEYKLQSPQQAIDSGYVWAVNEFATIHAYGRFYAGGVLEDDALDAAAPYFFARTRADEIDLTRLGSIGGSWGGMMALFGASRAPADAAPHAVVALSPPSDFVDLWTHSSTVAPTLYTDPSAAEGFYSPYWRRALPTLGTPPGGDGARPFTVEGICPALPGAVLVPHDDWDALIPVAQTEKLARGCSNVAPLYWRRPPPPSWSITMGHGQAMTDGSAMAYAVTFLVHQLAKPEKNPIATAVSGAALVAHLNLVVAEQRAARDVGYVLPRLRELADPRMVTVDNGQIVPVASVVASAVNAVWNTTFDANSIRTQLATGLPPPP